MRTTQLLFILCLLTFLCTSVRAQCPSNPDVVLSSQTDVDIYGLSHPNCTTLGNLTINGSNIDDISGLGNLNSITGNLTITATDLSDLSGLAGLAAIGGSLTLTNNASLGNCTFDAICTIAQSGTATVSGNTGDCADLATLQLECAPDCHPDLDALLDFYYALNGPNWLDQSGWVDGVAGTNCDVCTWNGVFCNGDGRVSSINMSTQNNLSGTIPASIGDLSALRGLTIRNNTVNGVVPAELFGLPEIFSISFWNTDLEGLPADVSAAQTLVSLDLTDNLNLDSPLPAGLFDLPLLNTLNIRNTPVSGALPATVGNASQLRRLWLWATDLSGPLPASLFMLSELELLDIRTTPFSGTLPDINGLSGVIDFIFFETNIGGDFPPITSGSLPDLETFSIQENQFTGPLPKIYGSPNLESYAVAYNNFSGTIPEDLFGTNSLKVINMRTNNLTGPLPESFGFLDLDFINLRANNLSGCYPESYQNLCGIVAGFPFSSNPGLPDGGSNNFFLGAFCGNGIRCDLCHPDFGALVIFYGATGGDNWTNKTGWEDGAVGADCDVCNWHGVTCVNGRVTRLELPDNNLTGALPDEIKDLTELEALRLNNNDFGGSSVPDLDELTKMQRLRLHRANFAGPLPDLGSMPDLQSLSLYDNAFTGPIPMEYSPTNLPALEFFYLDRNQLDGELPANVADFSLLKEFNVHTNNFSGCYPPGYTDLCGLDSRLFYGNPQLPEGGSSDFFNNTFCPAGTNPCGTTCPPEDLVITSQQDLTDFRAEYPNCTDLTAGLTLEGSNLPAAGINLIGLVSVGGSLEVSNAPQLTMLDFLSSLSSIGGAITINGTGVTNLQGLTDLDLTSGDLNLLDNDQLTSLSNLGGSGSRATALNSVENLRIIGNDQLSSLATLGGLTINQDLFILNNAALATCEAEAVCNQLFGSAAATIAGNASGCASRTEVETACSPLPVSWVNFTATARDKVVYLKWATAEEEQNDYYAAQRSQDGRAWTNLGNTPSVTAAANGLHPYQFTDSNPPNGELLYRIRQVNLDGTEDFSEVRRILFSGARAYVYPNPAAGDFTIFSEQSQLISLHSSDGRALRTIVHSGARTQVQAEGLRSGIYWLRFTASGEVVKLVVR